MLNVYEFYLNDKYNFKLCFKDLVFYKLKFLKGF